MSSSPLPESSQPRTSLRRIIPILGVVVILIGAYYTWNYFKAKPEVSQEGGQNPAGASGATRGDAGGASGSKEGGKGRGGVPSVAVATVKSKDFEVWLDSLGTVTPMANVTIHSRVDGELIKVFFHEGQTVQSGDLLAEIDPRMYQVQLDQANAALARDRALLENAKTDLKRYVDLVAHDAAPRQQMDTQASLVNQYEATLKTDQSAIDNARLQLSYCHIQAPISGQVGLRLVDQGNIIHASDAGGLVTIAQMDPISVIFSLPQDFLPALNAKRHERKTIALEVFDRSGNISLQKGSLASLDNQIDSTTGSVKLRGHFSNRSGKLYPNQFVNVRVLMDIKPKALVIPGSALQRGSQGTFVYVLGEDRKVALKPILAGPANRSEIVVESGIAEGDKVVIDGADKLKDGMVVNLADRPAGGGSHKKGEH